MDTFLLSLADRLHRSLPLLSESILILLAQWKPARRLHHVSFRFTLTERTSLLALTRK